MRNTRVDDRNIDCGSTRRDEEEQRKFRHVGDADSAQLRSRGRRAAKQRQTKSVAKSVRAVKARDRSEAELDKTARQKRENAGSIEGNQT